MSMISDTSSEDHQPALDLVVSRDGSKTGVRCVDVKLSGGLLWPQILKNLGALEREVALEKQALDSGLLQEGSRLVCTALAR
jgi:hypothetical protein